MQLLVQADYGAWLYCGYNAQSATAKLLDYL